MQIDLIHRSAFSGTRSIQNPVLLFNGYVGHLNASVPLHRIFTLLFMKYVGFLTSKVCLFFTRVFIVSSYSRDGIYSTPIMTDIFECLIVSTI